MPKFVRYSSSEDWSALYIDGKLYYVGDHYRVDERISELLGVETISSDAFMKGGNQRKDVANTLDELHNYELKIENNKEQADILRARGTALIDQANLMEKS